MNETARHIIDLWWTDGGEKGRMLTDGPIERIANAVHRDGGIIEAKCIKIFKVSDKLLFEVWKVKIDKIPEELIEMEMNEEMIE